MSTGRIVFVRSCARCFRVLAAESGDDCPEHTLSCCGGKGAMHASGCQRDAMYLAGVELARRREEAFWRAFLGPTDDERKEGG